MKPSPALIRQGSVVHWWLDAFGRTACRSWVGMCRTTRADVTCSDCLEGRTAEDTVTGPYGAPMPREKGQMSL